PEGVAALRRRVAGGSAGDDPVDGGAGPDGERGEGVAPDAAVTEAAETDGEPAEGEAAGEGAGDVVDDAPAIRAITITSADEQYFPVLARTLGEPVTTASAGGREVVLTSHGETAPGTFGWDEGALPIVQLIAGEDRSVYAVSDEAATARTWGTERTIVTGVGAEESFPALESALAPLDSDDDDARVIASVSPTADLEAVKAALRAPAETGPALLLDALGIGAGFADFLDGAVSAEEMPGARLWEPATAGQVFRGVLEDAFDEAADLKMVELASDFDARWPALSRSISVVKAAAGGALIVAAARSTKAWRSAGALTGGVLLLDSLADVVLYEWLRRRRER
nr:hypothetical protein [Actinomycetales bacterium]